MSDSHPVKVVLGVRWSSDVHDAIRAVDPRVELQETSALANIFATEPSGPALDEVRAAIGDAEVLVAWGAVSRQILEFAPELRWLHVAGAGLERLAETGGLEMGFTVTNSAGATSAPIAEWIAGAMLYFGRRFNYAVQNQAEHRWRRWAGISLEGKTVGIFGLGSIGREASRRLRPFGMRVIATRRSAAPGDTDPDCDLLLPQSELPRLLAESDYVVISAPLTDETRHIFDGDAFRAMKSSALLLNVARGGLVDHDALLEALQQGEIAGAALDVTEPEPLPPDSPLWDLPNVLITPHIAPGTDVPGDPAAELFVANLRAYLAGEPLANIIPPGRGY